MSNSNEKHSSAVRGIHHITAIASDPQRTVDFYTELLGLRMVKLTVNFDEPSVYHLYFGDRVGHPGTILTFFPFPSAARGEPGIGQVTVVAFRVPTGSVGFWAERLARKGIEFEGPFERFEAEVISFTDFDGLPLELVATATDRSDWVAAEIPADSAITQFDGVTLSLSDQSATAAVIERLLGMKRLAEAGNRFRYAAGGGDSDAEQVQNIDLLQLPDGKVGIQSAGTVHHIAWRCADAEQKLWRGRVVAAGLNVTPIIDRSYFHSIYFREPGGVLFEIATDEPGFAVDEPVEELGTHLKLPSWLEPRREQIERLLPPVKYEAQLEL